MLFVGLDWSLNSPAMTVIDNGTPHFYYFVKTFKKKALQTKVYDSFHPFVRPDFEGNDLERICYNAGWALHCLKNHTGNIILTIEGSALHAKGKVVTLGENVGAVKQALVGAGYHNLHVVEPTVVKKFATGKGNADKQMMYDSALPLFVERNLPEPTVVLAVDPLDSPISDIVDSYFLAQYAEQVLHNNITAKQKGLHDEYRRFPGLS